MNKLHKAIIAAVVLIVMIAVLYPVMRSDETTAGVLLDQEIKLQKQKQTRLDEIKQLDASILETRTKRTELQKTTVCSGTETECYIAGFSE